MSDLPNRTYMVKGRKPRPAVVDRVREDIDNAKENGHDLLAPGAMTDNEIAFDITECTGAYNHATLPELVAAVAVVRAERA